MIYEMLLVEFQCLFGSDVEFRLSSRHMQMELVVYIDVSRSCYQEFNVDYVLDFTDLIFGITRMDTDEVKAKK